jgi:hypothetical protein
LALKSAGWFADWPVANAFRIAPSSNVARFSASAIHAASDYDRQASKGVMPERRTATYRESAGGFFPLPATPVQ